MYKSYGEVYMKAVSNAHNAKYGGGWVGFENALEKEGLYVMYLDLKSDYFILTKFIEKYELDLDAIKAEIEANGYKYKDY